MKHDQICKKISELGFDSGWGVRNEKIVIWENNEKIPDELLEFVELDK